MTMCFLQTLCIPYAYLMYTLSIIYAYLMHTLCIPYAYLMHTFVPRCVETVKHVRKNLPVSENNPPSTIQINTVLISYSQYFWTISWITYILKCSNVLIVFKWLFNSWPMTCATVAHERTRHTWFHLDDLESGHFSILLVPCLKSQGDKILSASLRHVNRGRSTLLLSFSSSLWAKWIVILFVQLYILNYMEEKNKITITMTMTLYWSPRENSPFTYCITLHDTQTHM